jgi:hypothetical protein
MLRRIFIALSLAVLAACVASGTASAELPELGRCKNVGSGGAYSYSGCVVKAANGNGSFEWFPGPGSKPGFAANYGYNETKTAVLRTNGGIWKYIKCEYNVSEGEYTGPKTLNLTVLLFQCHAPGSTQPSAYCQKLGPAGIDTFGTGGPSFGEIELVLTGKLGYIEVEGKRKIGIDFKPAEVRKQYLGIWECGGADPSGVTQTGTGTGTLMGLEGGVIEQVVGPVNRMVGGPETEKEQYVTKFEANNAQAPEHLEGEPNDTLTRVTPPVGLERQSEPAFLIAEEEVHEIEEAIEFKES